MRIITVIHILDRESGERIGTFTFENGWTGAKGSWQAIPMVPHPSDADPLASYAEALRYDGHQVETEEGDEEVIEGRVY